jgi:Tol biopolymer transport system component
MKNHLFILIILLELLLFGCTGINENITSTPSGAYIYWGKTEGDLMPTGHKTPFHRSMAADNMESRCYQVRKKGYQDSIIICEPGRTTNHHVDFVLKVEKYIQPSVSVTGSASELKRITADEFKENYPRLSPDQEWLLVEVPGDDHKPLSKTVIEKINLETGTKVILSSKKYNSREGEWVPDSSAIVFSSDKLGVYTIVESSGEKGKAAVKSISNGVLAPARFPSVSPDGKDIAFSIYKSPDDSRICIMGIDGNNPIIYGSGFRPQWSPDGKTLLFVRKVGRYNHIYSTDVESGVNLEALGSTGANDDAPSWSPDGKYISFISDRLGDYRHLFLMQADGSGLTQLTDGKFNVYTASWGKDGFIYFSADAGGNMDIWRLKPKTE